MCDLEEVNHEFETICRSMLPRDVFFQVMDCSSIITLLTVASKIRVLQLYVSIFVSSGYRRQCRSHSCVGKNKMCNLPRYTDREAQTCWETSASAFRLARSLPCTEQQYFVLFFYVMSS